MEAWKRKDGRCPRGEEVENMIDAIARIVIRFVAKFLTMMALGIGLFVILNVFG